MQPNRYAVVGHRSHDPLSTHADLDSAIVACITRREIAAAKGWVTFGGFAVHNTDNYDLDCPDGLTEAERERVSQALDEAGVV